MDYKFVVTQHDIKLDSNANCPSKILALINILPEFGFKVNVDVDFDKCVEDYTDYWTGDKNESYYQLESVWFAGKNISIRWYNYSELYQTDDEYTMDQYLYIDKLGTFCKPSRSDWSVILENDLISIIEEIVMLDTFLLKNKEILAKLDKKIKYSKLKHTGKRKHHFKMFRGSIINSHIHMIMIGTYGYSCLFNNAISKNNLLFIRKKYSKLFRFIDDYYFNSEDKDFHPGKVRFKNKIRTKLVKMRYVLPEPLQHDVSIWRDRHDYWDNRKIRYSRKEKHPWKLPFRNRNITLDSYN